MMQPTLVVELRPFISKEKRRLRISINPSSVMQPTLVVELKKLRPFISKKKKKKKKKAECLILSELEQFLYALLQ